MEKIKSLLEKVGVKSELSQQICESLENYKSTLRKQFDAEYSAKIEEAKKVCIEETEAHKRELARRVQVFCETKGAAIEATVAKQSALRESEAVSRLKSIVSLVEGIEPNGELNGELEADVKKLKQKLRAVTEDKQQAIATANRQTALAEKVLKKNRILEAKKVQAKASAITEDKQPRKKPARIDSGRQSSQPVSTRATLVESQDPRPVPSRKDSHIASTGNSGGFGVDSIAVDMDEDLI
jgi:hypothetical protein